MRPLVDRARLEKFLVEREKLQSLFGAIVGELFRFPAIDAAALAEDLALAVAPVKGRNP